MGLAYGTACGEQVRAFVAQRQRAAKVYLRERGSRRDDLILSLGARCLELLRSWDHASWVEHQAEALDDTFELDVFAPIRQDWIDHTDAYFHRT